MSVTQNTTKQFWIQLGINIIASLIASYIMYRLLQPKDESSTAAARSSNPATTTSASTEAEPVA